MDPFEIFGVFNTGINGIAGDLRTVMLWGAGILLTMLGMGVVMGIINRQPGGSAEVSSPGISKADFNKYAQKRYKADLYRRTYEKRRYGKTEDVSQGDL